MYVSKRNTNERNYRQQIRQVRRKRPEVRREQVDSSGTQFAAPALASLPIIPDYIPSTFIVNEGLVAGAKIARNFLDAGILVDPSGETPALMVENSLNRWFDQASARLEYFSPRLELARDLKELEDGLDTSCLSEFKHIKNDYADTIAYGITYNNHCGFTLQEKIDDLETKVPGLGETAIYWLNKSLNESGFAVTPCFTLYAAQYTYWYGEDDERMVLEDWCETDEERENLDIVRRSDFDESIPVISHSPEEMIKGEKLAALVDHEDKIVAALASILCSMKKQEEYIEPLYPESHGEDHLPVTSTSICVCWSADDMTERVVDDYINQAYEAGNNTALNNYWVFDNSAEGVKQAQDNIGRFISRLETAESFLKLVATQIEN